MPTTTPDFVLLLDDDNPRSHVVKSCWVTGRLASESRDDWVLVTVDPPITRAESGIDGPDKAEILLAPHFQGDSLFPVSRWPLRVYVVALLNSAAKDKRVLRDSDYACISWGAVFPDRHSCPADEQHEAVVGSSSQVSGSCSKKPLAGLPWQMEAKDGRVIVTGKYDGLNRPIADVLNVDGCDNGASANALFLITVCNAVLEAAPDDPLSFAIWVGQHENRESENNLKSAMRLLELLTKNREKIRSRFPATSRSAGVCEDPIAFLNDIINEKLGTVDK